jgi:hypothetical protein
MSFLRAKQEKMMDMLSPSVSLSLHTVSAKGSPMVETIGEVSGSESTPETRLGACDEITFTKMLTRRGARRERASVRNILTAVFEPEVLSRFPVEVLVHYA